MIFHQKIFIKDPLFLPQVLTNDVAFDPPEKTD